MKKIYNSPASVEFNMQTEQMIAASLVINANEQADQWTNGSEGWNYVDWSAAEDKEF